MRRDARDCEGCPALLACRRLVAHVRPAAPRLRTASIQAVLACRSRVVPAAVTARWIDAATPGAGNAAGGGTRRSGLVAIACLPPAPGTGTPEHGAGPMAVVSTPSEFSVTAGDRWPQLHSPRRRGHGRAELLRSRLPRGPVSGLPSAAGGGSRPPPSVRVLRPHPVRRRRWPSCAIRGSARAATRRCSRAASAAGRRGPGSRCRCCSATRPDHTRLRALVSKAFTPRVVETLRGRVQDIVDRLLDRAADAPRMDVIDELAYPLPVTVISELLGVPDERQRGGQGVVAGRGARARRHRACRSART